MSHTVLNPQQFFHGTHAELPSGAMIEPGHKENFPVDEFTYPNPGKDVFFTAERERAHAYANKVAGRRGGYGHTYRVEPTGDYEPHQAGGYRSAAPLRVMEEL
jgi:hypothetical protein